MFPLTRSRNKNRFFGIAVGAPGFAFLVASSAGVVYVCSAAVLSSTNAAYGVPNNVLSSNGTSYTPI
jgi:hypothetical protein